jgi:transposase
MAAHCDTGTMAEPTQYSSKELNHLGLVAGMYEELGIEQIIDRVVPQESAKRKVSIGQAVKAMVLNGLGFTHRALYLSEQFFQDKPVDRLIGEGIEAVHLNDDVLGRALDSIYDYGPDRLYPQIAAPVVQQLGLSSRFGHLDSTSFHTDGQYNSAEEPEEGVIQLTQGYSRDHRPDLNQVVLQLICERQAGIPLLMKSVSGNGTDKEGFRDTITAHIEQLRTDLKVDYVVADSALYAAETLENMGSLQWISRVPETLRLARELLHATAADLMQQPEQMAWRSLGTVYAEVRQRWLVIYSPDAHQRARHTVDRQCRKLSSTESKAFERLCKQEFACEGDARKALATFEKTLQMTFVAEAQVTTQARYQGKGRPARDREPDFYVYCLDGALASRTAERTRRLERKSCFILATNTLDHKALSDEQLLAAYKDQQKVERGFRFLKDPLFMASTLFLKSPKRIMALMMVMTLCLLVYAALEYRIRQALQTQQQTFPDQKGLPSDNPTARWVFQYFSGIHLLVIAQIQTLVLNLNEHHTRLLNILGPRYERLYFGNG